MGWLAKQIAERSFTLWKIFHTRHPRHRRLGGNYHKQEAAWHSKQLYFLHLRKIFSLAQRQSMVKDTLIYVLETIKCYAYIYTCMCVIHTHTRMYVILPIHICIICMYMCMQLGKIHDLRTS